MIFSKRHKLAKEFEEWAKENGVLNCPESVITFLDIKGELVDDEPKIKYVDPIDFANIAYLKGDGSPAEYYTIEQLREIGYDDEIK